MQRREMYINVAPIAVLCCMLMTAHVSVVHSSSSSRAHIRLVGNGYEGLVVAIKPSCDGEFPIDTITDMAHNLQAYFTEASSSLYTATRQKAYIKDVTVFLPQGVSYIPGIELESSSAYSVTQASVVVDSENPVYDHQPYVVQPGVCGEPADYVHLTWQYLANDTLAHQYGHVGKSLTKLLASLLWGVFDETLDVSARNNINPDQLAHGIHSCPQASTIRVVKQDTDNEPCARTQKACDPVYELTDSAATDTASIMGYYHHPQVTQFCDDEPAEDSNLHNPRARTKHNQRCSNHNGMDKWSTMSIIENSQDFQDNINYDGTGAADQDTTPTFHFIQLQMKTIVLVLDASNSMQADRKLERLREAASSFIRNALVGFHRIGLVKFGTRSETIHPVIQIQSANDMASLIAALPTGIFGATCIACGINTAIQMIEESNTGSSTGGHIIVITDGAENIDHTGVLIHDITDHVLTSGVLLDSILYDEVSSTHPLHRLTANTHGRVLHAPTHTNRLAREFLALSQGLAGLSTGYTSVILSERYEVGVAESTEVRLLVDDGSSGSLQIYITCDNTTALTSATSTNTTPILITTPSSSDVITIDSFSVISVSTLLYTRHIEQEDRGNWTIAFTNTQQELQTYEILVTTSGQTTSCIQQPITIHPYVHHAFNFSELSPNAAPSLVLGCSVHRGTSPLPGVIVRADVTWYNYTFVYYLRDDGGGDPDLDRDDGYYSTYFLDFRGNGKYYVEFRVFGQPSIDEIHGREIVNAAGHHWIEFSRFIEGGYFEVYNQPVNLADLYPPGRVIDLQLLQLGLQHDSTSPREHHYALSYTATGDDYYTGNATSYDIRMSREEDTLASDFSACVSAADTGVINPGEVININRESGTRMLVNLQLTEEQLQQEWHFAIKGIDDVGNVGRVSNIATYFPNTEHNVITEQVPPRPYNTPYPPVDDTNTNDSSVTIIIIIVSVCGGVMVLVGSMGFCVYFVVFARRKKNKAQQSQSMYMHGRGQHSESVDTQDSCSVISEDLKKSKSSASY